MGKFSVIKHPFPPKPPKPVFMMPMLTQEEITELTEMLRELDESRLSVVLIPAQEEVNVGACIRAVESQNAQWYQEFCSKYTSIRGRGSKRYKRPRTMISRIRTREALNRMLAGDVSGTYAERLLEQARITIANRKRLKRRPPPIGWICFLLKGVNIMNIREKQEGADTITLTSHSVNLYTEGGDFVANVPMLPFPEAPKVLAWGNRVFMYAAEQEQYRETFAFSIPQSMNFPEAGDNSGLPEQDPLQGVNEMSKQGNKLTEDSPAVKAGVDQLNKTKEATCKSCGVPNGLHQRQCPVYQAQLTKLTESRKICPACSSVFDPTAKFCARCGKNLD